MGEENQQTFDEIYLALSELASKQKTIGPSTDTSRNPIGFIKPKE